MSGAMVHTGGITPSVRIEHESRGLKKSAGEIGERFLVLERYPDDDPSGVRYCVCVHHPEYVQTPTGRSRQEPEIVWRGNDETVAKRAYATYCKLLGGTPPSEYDAPPGPTDPGKRYITRGDYEADHVPRADYEALLARVVALEESAHKKK